MYFFATVWTSGKRHTPGSWITFFRCLFRNIKIRSHTPRPTTLAPALTWPKASKLLETNLSNHLTYPLVSYLLRHKVILVITVVGVVVERKRSVIPLLVVPKHFPFCSSRLELTIRGQIQSYLVVSKGTTNPKRCLSGNCFAESRYRTLNLIHVCAPLVERSPRGQSAPSNIPPQ